jgi:tRNA threonylcarbamoyladenosine biosynthesis protein TsaE
MQVLSSQNDSVLIGLADPAATIALGAALGQASAPTGFVALNGPLGAGKSTLARGLIAAWTGQQEDAPSPTYTLVQTYDGPRGTLWHADLYRLRSPDEVEELGLLEACLDGLMVVEWAQRLGPRLPSARLDLTLALTPDARTALISWPGLARPLWIDALE